MDAAERRSFKVTNSRQFQVLVNLMKENIQLARSIPVMGHSRYTLEEAWDEVARQVNLHGPPERTGYEWKKIWADLKCRTKKKICDKNKEEGSGRIVYLSDLEQSVDKLLNFSAMNALQISNDELPKESTLEDDLNTLLEPCEIKTEEYETTEDIRIFKSSSECAPKKPKVLPQLRFLGKRKYDKNEKQIKLLQVQIRTQEKMLAAIQTQSKAVNALAETAYRQAESMAVIAESTQSIALAIQDAVKYFKKERPK